MNPSTALASVLVDELVRCGVREAVLCPGSRSAPLAYALGQADRDGRLRLHVRVDERSAGFLALGLAKLSRVPAVVITTSGTAVANLHPAVLEAHHAAVPMLVLSADRPPELRGTGANQTTTQPGLLGPGVRWSHELGAPERRAGQVAGWRSSVCRAYAAACGSLGGAPGPVHLNVPLREPLVPTAGEPGWPESLDGRDAGAPWVSLPAAAGAVAGPAGPAGPPGPAGPTGSAVQESVADAHSDAHTHADAPSRTLVLVGDLPEPGQLREVATWAAARGWPVIAEPFGPTGVEGVLRGGSLLLSAHDWVATHLPERVVTAGRITLSRDVAALLRRPGLRVEAVTPVSDWADPSHVVHAVHPWSVLAQPSAAARGGDWARCWQEAAAAVTAAVREQGPGWPSGTAVAGAVVDAMPSGGTLFVGSSNAVRDLDLATPRGHGSCTVVASRGLAGIDGCVSTAIGLALDRGPSVALLGDLTFLHDANGLLIGPDEPRPDLAVVVLNDDGGGIFTLLEPGEPGEPGEPERVAAFERLFGTPTGTDLASLCRAHGIPHVLAGSAAELAAAVSGPERSGGLRVVEVRADRGAHRGARARLRELVATTLAGSTAEPGAAPGTASLQPE